MLPPAEYAERYRNLEVPFDDGAVTVRVDQYRLGDPKPGSAHAKDDLWQGLKDHFQETSAPAYWVVESTGGKGLVVLTGEVGAVRTAVAAGVASIKKDGMLIGEVVIPYAHEALMKTLTA